MNLMTRSRCKGSPAPAFGLRSLTDFCNLRFDIHYFKENPNVF